MAIKIIGLDIDGTLLTPEGTVSEGTRRALTAAADKGVHIVPVTGRPLSGIPEALDGSLGIDYMISSNGASVWHKGEYVMGHRISPAVCSRLLKEIEGEYYLAEVFVDGVGYVDERGFNHAVKYFGGGRHLDYFIKSRRAVKDIFAFLETVSGVEEIAVMSPRAEQCERIINAVSEFTELRYARPVPSYLEIIAADGGKGTALIKLAQKLGIEREEVMAVGDSDNDADMLKKAGLPVAMGNADEALKQIARYVTETNANDGVAAAVEKFVL